MKSRPFVAFFISNVEHLRFLCDSWASCTRLYSQSQVHGCTGEVAVARVVFVER